MARGVVGLGILSKIAAIIRKLNANNVIPLSMMQKRLVQGNSIIFWHDPWLGNQPSQVCFNKLFRLKLDPDCAVGNRWVDGE